MSIKLHYLIFLLHISLLTLTAQIKPDFIRIDFPSFVPAEKHFKSSIVFKLKEIRENIVEIKLKKNNNFKINSAIFEHTSDNINFKISTDGNFITFNFDCDKYNITTNLLYQIILDCHVTKSSKIDKNELLKIEETDVRVDKIAIESARNRKLEEITFYKSQKTAGKSLLFNENSKLEFKLSGMDLKNLYTEFWIKTNGLLDNSFSVIKSNTNESLISISQNDFGFVSFPIFENELTRNDVYISSGSWNYFGILLSNTHQGILCEVYVNGKLVLSTMYDKLFSSENFKVAFANTTKNKFEIDRLKIWDYNNNLEIANINKHFINYEADSSSVIFHTNFENLDEFYNYKNSKQLFLNVENVNYKNSDAPIFSKAPQLTVNVGSSYNSIVWYVQEYKVAKEFILERALGDGKFIEVFKMQAEYDPLKIYNYTDEVIAEADVAFYRVKQINDDGSYVFSAEVKIGHKEIHEFNLGQNYPNPFNPITNLYVEVIITSEFDINVYDLVGNNVKKVFKGVLPEGLHTFEFDGASLPSGIYFYEVMSPHSQIVKKMILAK